MTNKAQTPDILYKLPAGESSWIEFYGKLKKKGIITERTNEDSAITLNKYKGRVIMPIKHIRAKVLIELENRLIVKFN